MPDWNHLRIALAVIETGGIGGAAARLGVSAATVSRNLAALESDLGQPILDRTPGRVQITPFGERIVDSLRSAERALADVGRAADQGREQVVGTVRLATMPMLATLFIVPEIPAFRRTYPELTLELMLHHQVVNLGRGDADLALRGARPTQENLRARCLSRSPMCAWAAPSLLAAHPDLTTLPWVGWPSSTDVLELRWLDQLVPNDRVVLRVDDPHTHVAACEAGIGATILTAEAAQLHGLSRVPGFDDGPNAELWLVMPEALRGVPRMDAVWDWISGRFEGP